MSVEVKVSDKYDKDYAHRTFDKYASQDVVRDEPGFTLIMSGNEAVARGVIEAGATVATSYPGSPTTYILDSISYAAKKYDFHAEWSTNEKVAFEVALGAATCGKDAVTITKNVGMSWFVDPMLNCMGMGLPGALVMIIGDDPAANTSSVEMDSRLLAMAAEIPVLEPITNQEAKEITIEAFRLSRKLGMPVMVRITRGMCYGRGEVTLGAIDHQRRSLPASFDHDPVHWTCNVSPEFLGENLAYVRHKRYHEQVVPMIVEEVKNSPFNELKLSGKEKIGVISAGLPYMAAKEALEYMGVQDEIAVLKLGTVYPIPQELVEKLLSSVDKVFVFEEVEPFIELQVRDIAAGMSNHARIFGKKTGHVKICGSIDRDDVVRPIAESLGKTCNIGLSTKRLDKFLNVVREEIVHRPQGYFCPGCPEMAGIFAGKRIAKKLYGGNFISHGDIGCYEHGHAPPWDFLNSVLCMGAGPAMGSGNYHAGVSDKVICNLGDSTFFHAAIPALINAVYNKVEITFLIYDNRCTASTGHQPHPGAFGVTAKDEPTKILNIEDVARACQVDYIKICDPYNVKETLAVIEEAYKVKGVSMVVLRQTCAVLAERQKGGKAKAQLKLFQINTDQCLYYKKGSCLICVKELGCPSIMLDGNELYIDPVNCFGCSVCSQVCPSGAITEGVR